MAVVVGRMVAVLEAQTAQFEARMGAAGQQLSRWNSATTAARRSTAMLKTGIQQLAFEGLGVMPPALARVSAGMLTLFGPGGVMLGAIAILGIISFAFERAGKKAQEFVEEANRAREFRLDHLKMLGGVGGDFQMTPAENLAHLRAQRAELVKQIEARRALTQSVVAQIGGFDPVAKRASDEIDALTVSLRNLDRQLAMLASEPAMERFRFMLSNLRGISGFEFTPGGLRRGGFQAPPFGGAREQELHFLPRDPFAGISQHFGRGTTPPRPKSGFQVTPEFAIMSMMALMQGAQSGSTAGFLGAAAGPIAMINPLAGAITSLFGGLASLFERQHSERERNEERRKNELIGAIREGPTRVTEIFEGDREMSRYTRDRDDRLGGGPSRMGV